MSSSNIPSVWLTLHADRPTAISSSRHGANIDGVAFNLVFIAQRQPLLASKIMDLYRVARQLAEDDPKAHDEDYLTAKSVFENLVGVAG